MASLLQFTQLANYVHNVISFASHTELEGHRSKIQKKLN